MVPLHSHALLFGSLLVGSAFLAVIALGLAYWVFRDATARDAEFRRLVAALVFVCPPVAIAYPVVRRRWGERRWRPTRIERVAGVAPFALVVALHGTGLVALGIRVVGDEVDPVIQLAAFPFLLTVAVPVAYVVVTGR